MVTMQALMVVLGTLLVSISCSHCTDVIHADRSFPGLSADTAATSWLEQQGKCSKWFKARRPLTPQEQELAAARTGRSSSSNVSDSAGLNTRQDTGCTAVQNSWCPALLWTYTGTGNTMTRMLIEAASGWYTGSVYTDLSLVGILPGEYLCDSSVLAVKAHPQWHSFASLSPDGLRPDTPHVPPDAKEICPCAYDRAVAVIRDPYATFLAEYKRILAHDYDKCSHGLADGQDCKGGHVSILRQADFDPKHFRSEVMRMAAEWSAMFDSYDAFAAAHPQGFYLTTFENLTDPDTRTQALVDLLETLGAPPTVQESAPAANHQSESRCGFASATCMDSAACAEPWGAQTPPEPASDPAAAAATCAAQAGGRYRGYDEERLGCAFQLARHPLIYRPKDPQGVDAQYVYGGDEGRQLVCDVWAVVGVRAAAHGYDVFAGGQC